MEEKRRILKEKIESVLNSTKSIIEFDFDFNLLLSAAQSYKHDTVLKPFPSAFLTSDNQQKYDSLVSFDEMLEISSFNCLLNK